MNPINLINATNPANPIQPINPKVYILNSKPWVESFAHRVRNAADERGKNSQADEDNKDGEHPLRGSVPSV